MRLPLLKDGQVDLAFLALHAGAGEDGRLQQALENAGVRYTGSGPEASARAMNKIVSKHIFEEAGVSVPRGKSFIGLTQEKAAGACEEILRDPGLPLVVKPANQGSTIGISIVREEKELAGAVELALRYDADILAEEFISGREITAAVLGNNSPRVLPLVEIVPKSGFYDYHAKYLASDTEKIVPARLSDEITRAAGEAALRAYRALGCRGFARVDMIAGERGVFVLEVNTIPGMTSRSLVPRAAGASGLNFPALLDEIIQLSLEESTDGR
jgi:D-alanine-D-alanine ligase